jgi:hypothetical protein
MDVGILTIAGVGAVPLVLALVQLVKGLGLPVQYAPLLSVLIGVALVGFVEGYMVDSIMTGLVVGLSASGLWSGTRALMR